MVNFSGIGFGDVDAFEIFKVPVVHSSIRAAVGKGEVLWIELKSCYDLSRVLKVRKHLVSCDIPDFKSTV